jgi:hypothetical protein
MGIIRGAKVEVECLQCGISFMARVADRKRGWAKFHNKSCKAKHQEARTGQYAKYLSGSGREGTAEQDSYEDGWDAHKDSF